MASAQQKPYPEPHTGSILHEKTPFRARVTTAQRRLSKMKVRKDQLLPKRFAIAEDEGLARSLLLAREASISQGRPLSENEAIRNIEAQRFEKWKSLRRAKKLQSPASRRSQQRLQPYRLPRRGAAMSLCNDCRRHLSYYTVASGPVQLLERFQWALLIAGIETNDPVHRDWIRGNIADPSLKSALELVLDAQRRRPVSMREIRQLVSGTPSDPDSSLSEVSTQTVLQDGEDTADSGIPKIGDDLTKTRTTECGKVDVFGPKEQKKLVRKIEVNLMPILIVSYGLHYLDKTSLSYSAILGIQEDLGLAQANEYQILFLLFGLITVAWSAVVWFFVPDSPRTARFLTPAERETAALRPMKFQRTTQTKKWDKVQFIEAITDVNSWWFFLFSFVTCIPNGGTTSFSTLVIKSFGYDSFKTILMGLPASAFQLTTVILAAIFTTMFRKSRLIALVLVYLMAISGFLMIKLLPTSEKLSRLAGFWLITAVAPAFPLMLSLSSINIAGFTKKSTVMALIFLGYCAGNLRGPQFFISTEAPNYHTAYTAILACFAITIALVVLMRFYLARENKMRDREQGVRRDAEETREIDLAADENLLDVDETDKQNRDFRCIM
ncbi:hypothetical protein LQW54_003899 [Pestalotiopsis sp. IQ-011]